MKKEPLHFKTKKTILDWITSGRYKKNERLPTDRKLSETLKVSRITILRALKELEEEGCISREQGRGTYVKNKKPNGAPWRPAKSKIKISFGINGYREYGYFYKFLAKDFQQENPECEVEIASVPMSARGRDFPYLKKIASGNAPSTGEFFMHSDYAALDGLIPLENMENYNEITNELHPKLRDLKTADSSGSLHIHAIPTHYTPRLLLTNTSILTEAGLDTEKGPKTLEELNKWIQTLSKRGKKSHKKYRSFHMDYPTHCDATIAYFPYLWNISGYTKANNKEEFAETLTKNSDWLEYFCKLYKSNSSFRAERGPENFILGKTAIALSDGSNILRLTDCLYPDFEIKAFPIPPLKKGAPSISSIGDLSVGIFRAGIKNEAELEASWRWIKFLLRPDTQKKLTDRHWTLPASTKTQIPPLMNKNKEAFTNAIKNAKPQYDFKGARQTLTILAREMLKAIESQKTAKQATIDAKNKILESII